MSNARYAAYLNKEAMKTERRVSLVPSTHLTRTSKVLFIEEPKAIPVLQRRKTYIVVIEVRLLRKTFCYEPTCDLASCQLDAYLSLSWVYGNPMEPQRPESAQKLKLDRVLVHPGIKSKL